MRNRAYVQSQLFIERRCAVTPAATQARSILIHVTSTTAMEMPMVSSVVDIEMTFVRRLTARFS